MEDESNMTDDGPEVVRINSYITLSKKRHMTSLRVKLLKRCWILNWTQIMLKQWRKMWLLEGRHLLKWNVSVTGAHKQQSTHLQKIGKARDAARLYESGC